MSYPRALTRAVLCMLLSLMLLACEEGGKGTPGSSGPREVVIIKLEPRREVYTTALAGRIASFQVAEVRPQVGGILQQRLSGLKPGDRVIVEGGQNVRPGMSVKIRGEG